VYCGGGRLTKSTIPTGDPTSWYALITLPPGPFTITTQELSLTGGPANYGFGLATLSEPEVIVQDLDPEVGQFYGGSQTLGPTDFPVLAGFGGGSYFLKFDWNPLSSGVRTFEAVVTVSGMGGCDPVGAVADVEHCDRDTDHGGEGEATAGDPISTGSGAFYLSAEDLSIGGRAPGIDMSRAYSSRLVDVTDGAFGPGWSFSWGARLLFDKPGIGQVTLIQESCARMVFTTGYEGKFVANSWVSSELQRVDTPPPEVTTTYELKRRSGELLKFDSAGRMLEKRTRLGQATTLGYTTGGELATVTDPAGRTLTFTWGDFAGQRRVMQVTDPPGRSVLNRPGIRGGSLPLIEDESYAYTWSVGEADYAAVHAG